MERPILAMPNSAAGADYKAAGPFAKEHGFEAIDWSLERLRIPVREDKRRMFFDVLKKASSRHGFHAPFSDMDIGHADHDFNRVSMYYMKLYLDFLEEISPTHFTIHIETPEKDLDWNRVVENLADLVAYGKNRGVSVSIENLTSGPASKPETLLNLAEETGAAITFDIGHVIGSDYVKLNKGRAEDFLRIILPYVSCAHIYEAEDGTPPRHLPPKDLSLIGPSLELLLESQCNWWMIELWNRLEDLFSTRKMLEDFLNKE